MEVSLLLHFEPYLFAQRALKKKVIVGLNLCIAQKAQNTCLRIKQPILGPKLLLHCKPQQESCLWYIAMDQTTSLHITLDLFSLKISHAEEVE